MQKRYIVRLSDEERATARSGKNGHIFPEILATLAWRGHRAVRSAFGGSFLRHRRTVTAG